LSTALRVPAISTGEILRRECLSQTSTGNHIRGLLESGGLVDDSLVNDLVAKRLGESDCRNGCILDGFPRTVSQAEYLDGLLACARRRAPIVFKFQIDCEEVVARLSRRRQCVTCGGIFSIGADMGSDLAVCPEDQSPLEQRADDRPETIRERLRLYERNTEAIVRFYADADYHEINACRAPQEVSRELLAIIERTRVNMVPRFAKTAHTYPQFASAH
jgi:adenylate kinase